MPKLSLFTPLGLLKLSAKQSPAESFYGQMRAALGDQFALDEGTHVEASVYARAMALGRAATLLEHAGDQAYPATITELIPSREAEFGIVPGPLDSIADRRRTLGAATLLPKGATYTALVEAFGALLGDDFLGIRPTPSPEAVNYPTELGDQPMNLQLPEVERKFIRLMEPLTSGGPEYKLVDYLPLDPNKGTFDAASRVLVGDVLVVDSENASRTERVTVTLTSVGEDGFAFAATFTNTHAAGVSATTMPFPLWMSSKRHYMIALSPTAAVDAEKRRKTNELAARLFSCVATWSIVAGTVTGGVGLAGPFTVGEGLLGVTPLGSMYF